MNLQTEVQKVGGFKAVTWRLGDLARGNARASASTSSRRQPQFNAGFTLIEMMVALAIFSLAALALVRLQGATVRNTATVDAQAMAQIVANNIAVESLTDSGVPTIGDSSGQEQNGGQAWRWSRTVATTADPKIIRIDIAVADPRGRPAARLTLARITQ
jgi:general secretion pathway protein I